jgi:dinuclear metal center YbgI/SA1388 family protein
MVKIREVVAHLEQLAPPVYQESYDNAGLITGDPNQEVRGVICCLDSTEAVIDEAIAKGCNLVVAHHPIVFSGLKRFTGRTYVERVVIKAIQHGIAIYAIHTNLDNMYHRGVNTRISERLGLRNTQILVPKRSLKTAVLRGSIPEASVLRQAGAHTLTPLGGGQVSVIYPSAMEGALLGLLRTAGTVMEAVQAVEDGDTLVGAGMIGELSDPVPTGDFLQNLKRVMGAGVVRHTALTGKLVQRIAVCGGAGGFLLKHAIAQGADVFVTADYKYHEFFDAEGRIIIADIGHYESEQFTIELLHEIITENFATFAAYCTEVSTNPVHYL